MTRERINELWPVMEGFKNGETVQTRPKESTEPWMETLEPQWAFKYDYRLKPKPVEAWANVYQGNDGSVYSVIYDSKEIALSHATTGFIRTVKLVEAEDVLPKPKTKPLEIWVNIYENEFGGPHISKEDAIKGRRSACLRTVKFVQVEESKETP